MYSANSSNMLLADIHHAIHSVVRGAIRNLDF
jgi:hypothetical protein